MICYKEETVRILEEFCLVTAIEALHVSMGMCGEKVLLVLVYRPPRQQARTSVNSIFLDIFGQVSEYVILLGNSRTKCYKKISTDGTVLIKWKESWII